MRAAFGVFMLLVIVGSVWVAIGREARSACYQACRPFIPVVLLAWLAVAAAVLIAYFGGHIRVL